MKEKINIGFIGVGFRGSKMLKYTAELIDGVDVTMLYDIVKERANTVADEVEALIGTRPIVAESYREILDSPDIDAVVLMTGWEDHINIAVEAMRAGKDVGMEVGGAYSIDDCWRLVRTHEETGKHCMMLENDCYNETHLALINMINKGVLGEISHCSGGYHHDICYQVIGQAVDRGHYRFDNYRTRNCENYPTHELGPIAKFLKINRGNRMLTVASIASKQRGIKAYIQKDPEKYGHLNDVVFNQGDIVVTTIKCAGGETIALTLDTTLPRYYSGDINVHGTKGLYCETNYSIYLDELHNAPEIHNNWMSHWGNASEFVKKYGNPIWDKYRETADKTGHDGIDYMVMMAFYESVKKGVRPPIDTYDTATWACITPLSEHSVATGGTPMQIPDFTNGRWATYKKDDSVELEFSLE